MSIEAKYKIPKSSIQKMEHELLMLRPSDIITKYKLARKTNLSVETAEELLIELFKSKVLKIIIRVECVGEEESDFLTFNSLEDFYNASYDVSEQCQSTIDWKNAKVAFKRGVYN